MITSGKDFRLQTSVSRKKRSAISGQVPPCIRNDVLPMDPEVHSKAAVDGEWSVMIRMRAFPSCKLALGAALLSFAACTTHDTMEFVSKPPGISVYGPTPHGYRFFGKTPVTVPIELPWVNSGFS